MKPTTSIFRIAIVILVIAAIIAGYLLWQKISYSSPMARTPGGQLMEALLPENTNTVVSYNPSDSGERINFTSLWDIVLQDKKDALLPLIAQEFTGAKDFDLSMEDIVKLFGENFSFVAGLSGGTEPTTETKPPEFYFIFSIEDPVHALTVLEKNKGAFSGEIQFGVTGDVAFITNAGDEAVNKLVTRAKKKIPTGLAGTKLFKEVVSQFTQPFSGYMYTITAGNNLFLPARVGDFDFSAIQSSAMTMHSEQGGLRFKMYAVGDSKRLAEADTNLSYVFEPYSAHLYKKVPGADSIMFAESHHLGSLLESELSIIAPSILMTKENLLAQFKTYTGFDFHEDIIPFSDKGFVMSIQDTGSIIPALSLFVDVSDAPEKAAAVVEDLDFNVPDRVAYVNLALQATQEEPIMEMSNFEAIDVGASVKLHLDNLPESTANIPLFDLTGTIEISYGLTGENILFFSTFPGFEEAFIAGKTIEDSEFFRDLNDTNSSLDSFVVIDGKVIGDFVNHAVETAKESGKFSPSNEAGFEVLQKHLAPIKGFFQNNRGNGQSASGEAFLKISQ